MLVQHLQSSLQQAPEINSAIRDVTARAAAVGEIKTDEELCSVIELLYAPVADTKTRSIRVRSVLQDLVKAKSIPKASNLEEDFV